MVGILCIFGKKNLNLSYLLDEVNIY